jgi:hypothetical protein
VTLEDYNSRSMVLAEYIVLLDTNDELLENR